MVSTTRRALAIAILSLAMTTCKVRDGAIADTGVEASVDALGDGDAAVGDGDAAVGDALPDCKQPTPKQACTDGWCRIEPGCFVIGAPRDEYGAGALSDRQARVTLTRPFLLQQTELTQKLWLTAGFPNPSGSTPAAIDCIGPDCPVGNINWWEAAAFANFLSRTSTPPLPECYRLDKCTGDPGAGMICESATILAASIYECAGIRLPTEAEWEYAARASTTTAFFAGPITVYSASEQTTCNVDPVLDKIGWYCLNSGKTTHPVGLKLPNAWGLFDVSGNAAEWVEDRFDGLGYGGPSLVDPVNHEGKTMVLRGGAAPLPAIICKSSYRFQVPATGRSPTVGVRLARSVPRTGI